MPVVTYQTYGAITSIPASDNLYDIGSTTLRFRDVYAGTGLRLTDSGGNTIGLLPPTGITSYTLTYPASQGGANTVLSNNGSGVFTWVTQGALAVLWSSINAPTATQTLAMANYATTWNWGTATTQTGLTITANALSTGVALAVSTTSTAWTAATQSLTTITASGANATAAVTVQGLSISVTNTNAVSGTNTGLAIASSGATTRNYAINITGGVLGFNTGAAASIGTYDANTLNLVGNAVTRVAMAGDGSTWAWQQSVTVSSTGTLTVNAFTSGGTITLSAARDIVGQAATASMLRVTDGTTAIISLDSRTTVDGNTTLKISPIAPTVAGVAGSAFNGVGIAGVTFTTSTTTTITALRGLSFAVTTPTVAQSGGAVTVTLVSTVDIAAPTTGALVTATTSAALTLGGGLYFTASSTIGITTGTLTINAFTLGGTLTLNGQTLSGTAAGTPTFSGAVTFSAAGTAISVTNNATISGTATIGTVAATTINAFTLGGTVTLASNQIFAGGANAATIFRVTDGTTALISLDSRNTTDGVKTISLQGLNQTIAGVAGSAYNSVAIGTVTFTTSSITTITALKGLGLAIGTPTVAQSGGAVTVTLVSTADIAAPTIGASVTATNSAALTLGGNLFFTASSTLGITSGTLTINAFTLGGTLTLNGQTFSGTAAGAWTASGAVTFSAAGTAISVTNNATISGTATIGTVAATTINAFTLGGAITGGTNTITAAAFISNTANPSGTGIIRLANAEGIFYRNAANTANIRLIDTDASNNVQIGNAAGSINLINAFAINSTAATAQFFTASQGAGTTTYYIGNASINTTSDVRLKAGLTPAAATGALALLASIPLWDHTWNDPTDKAPVNRNSRGPWRWQMSAQELVKAAPWLVNAPDRTCVDCLAGRACAEHPWSWVVDYGYMSGLFVAGFREIQTELELLRRRVAVLEGAR